MLHLNVQRLVRNPVFAGILIMFAEAKWEVIKGISYEGQVCLNHVGVDLTNWTYTVFYTLLLGYADEATSAIAMPRNGPRLLATRLESTQSLARKKLGM